MIYQICTTIAIVILSVIQIRKDNRRLRELDELIAKLEDIRYQQQKEPEDLKNEEA